MLLDNNKTVSKTAASFIIFLILFWFGCIAEQPSPVIIEKAKIQTRAILDSLNKNHIMIIEQVDVLSEGYNENTMKYLINYEITSGLDSTNLTTTETTAFLEKQNDVWKYRFIFDETYERELPDLK